MAGTNQTLGKRLGITTHMSPLRFKLITLQKAFPIKDSCQIEEWLARLANARGARIVTFDDAPSSGAAAPSQEALSNEELVVALCQAQCMDHPQILRLAAQMISQKVVQSDRLVFIARRERVSRMLAELARQAVRVDPRHETWEALLEAFRNEPRLREPLLHWTRIAEPIMKNGRCNAAGWKLVA